jgi:hypothetical protein
MEMNEMENLKVTIGLVDVMLGNMPGDENSLFPEIRSKMQELAKQLGFNLVIMEKPVLTEDEGETARKFMDDQKVDFTLILHSSLGSGRAFLPLARVNSCLGIWSIPEPATSGIMQLNAICGLNLYSAIIGNYMGDDHIPFKWFYGYMDNPLFIDRFKVTLNALKAVKKLRQSRIGLVGNIANGFENLNFDERIPEKKLGLKIFRRHTVEEIVRRAELYSAADVEKMTGQIVKEGAWNKETVTALSMERFARVSLAMDAFIEENNYDAIALSCWPKFQQVYDLAVCGVVSRLNERGIATSCEGDIPGVINMMMLNAISGQPSTMMDLAGLDDSDGSLLMWHCGPAPKSFADEQGLKWDAHFNIGCKCNGKWCGNGVIADLTFKPGQMTVSRLNNQFDRLLAVGCNAMANKQNYGGSGGWINHLEIGRQKLSNHDFMNTVIANRVDHHYEMTYGNFSDELFELAAWLGMEIIKPLQYENYMQPQR